MKLKINSILFFLLIVSTLSAQTLRVVSYNVENLFDWKHDSLKNDLEYTSTGLRHWTYSRYKNKTEQIARVIVNISKEKPLALIGLCEIENENCVQNLNYKLRHFHYRTLHYESSDERGVDVALLYDPKQFRLIDSAALYVDLGEDHTRDILYAAGIIANGDTLHIMVCHLPSMIGGKTASQWKRDQAKKVIQTKIDSIYSQQPNASIIIMGDMNSSPVNDLLGVENMMLTYEKKGKGTHKYHGIWTCLDQFYVSPYVQENCKTTIYDAVFLMEKDVKFLDLKPKRTFVGYRYNKDGYSDHLPIYMEMKVDYH